MVQLKARRNEQPGWAMTCPLCTQWWQVRMNPVILRPGWNRDDCVLAAVDDPETAGAIRRHCNTHQQQEESTMPTLSEPERRTARRKLAHRRGVSERQITNTLIDAALASGELRASDCASDYRSGTSSSNYDSPSGVSCD